MQHHDSVLHDSVFLFYNRIMGKESLEITRKGACSRFCESKGNLIGSKLSSYKSIKGNSLVSNSDDNAHLPKMI